MAPQSVISDLEFENNVNTTTTPIYSEHSYYTESNETSAIFTLDPNNNGSSIYYSDNEANYGYNSSASQDMDTFATTTAVNSNVTSQAVERQITQFWIGVGLSISSSVFIGLSFIIKKKALIRLSKGGKRANQGGYGYLKDLLWWSGLLSMAIGEAANFMAYTFAPASLVSTLGVLSVLVTAILSSKYLHERLNFLGKIGCFLCAIGSTIIVIHAPMEKDIESMEDLESKLTNVIFLIYVLLTIVISVILIYHYRPKLPETSTYTLLIWIGVCSMIGSLSVMSVKGLGLALMNTVTGIENEVGNWLTWFCFITLVICVSVQMNFLNKALDTFNTAVVTPIYYVFFTTCVILASAILFNEFSHLPIKDWMGLSCGFFTVLTAIALLHLCKNFDFTLVNLAQQIDFVNSSHSSTNVGGGTGSHHNYHAAYLETVKGEGLPLPICPSSSSTSCAIPVVGEMESTRRSRSQGNSSESELEEEIYKSVDSCNSTRSCGGMKMKKSTGSPLISPDSRRNRDGYRPLSYGTTE